MSESSGMSDSTANRDEASKCISIARRALADGDVIKAEKWARKAQGMFSCRQTTDLMVSIAAARGGGGGTHSGQQQQQHYSAREGGGGVSAQTAGGGQRRPAAAASAAHDSRPVVDVNAGTPEQRQLVRHILAAKTLYDVLAVPRGASDDDVRKAYRKLALKLHPDKCQAAHADEAFKAVSKAYICLADHSKRAYYDRTGYESNAAAALSQQAAAQQAQRQVSAARASGGPFRGPGSYSSSASEDFDTEEIFRAFFGGSSASQPRSSYTQAANAAAAAAAREQAERQKQAHAAAAKRRRAAAQREWELQEGIFTRMCFIMTLIAVLSAAMMGVIAYTVASGSFSAYSLTKSMRFGEQMRTTGLEVDFYVRKKREFERIYPRFTLARRNLEHQVESAYLDTLQQRCYHERMHKQRLAGRWSTREEARAMKLPRCEELETLSCKANPDGQGQPVGTTGSRVKPAAFS
ncbi:hypothetical protein FOA52_012344 [Chlamydomonas sp. UWO 241]|nr:hypothetical protein FOA52_012344 [Chlamydomonas sp. UWO 241]